MASRGTPYLDSAKRDAILGEAIRTFCSVGLRNADVQVIADRAGVGKGTVYRYFGSKEDLFWAACLSVLERVECELERVMAQTQGALQTLRASGLAYARFFETHPELIEMLVLERAEFRGSIPPSHFEYHEKLIGRYAAILRSGIDAGEVRPSDVRKTIDALANLLYGTVVGSCYSKGRVGLAEMAEHALDIFLAGLRTEKPQLP